MSGYYDRQGNPLKLMEWMKLFDDPKDRMAKKRVTETTLADGKWISTVWLGLDHSFGAGPPLIFETMVFPAKGDMGDLDCERYSTEAEAQEGHARMVQKWSAAASLQGDGDPGPTAGETPTLGGE